MFEALESRQLFSATLTATATEPATEPTTTPVVEQDATAAKPKPSSFNFTHYYDKASPVLA